MADEEKLFTVREIANHYRVSEETVRRWMRNGDIPYTPVGPFRMKRLKLTDPITKETKNVGEGTTGEVSGRTTEGHS